jgi:hypothetical protein
VADNAFDDLRSYSTKVFVCFVSLLISTSVCPGVLIICSDLSNNKLTQVPFVQNATHLGELYVTSPSVFFATFASIMSIVILNFSQVSRILDGNALNYVPYMGKLAFLATLFVFDRCHSQIDDALLAHWPAISSLSLMTTLLST